MRKKRETEETDENMLKIQAIENKYGLVLFRMGLTHLFDVGWRNFSDENVEETMKQLKVEDEKNKAEGVNPVMTYEFQCDIVGCSAELSKIGIWDLFRYIKKYVTIA